jgi:hypothetical protein
MAAPRATCSGPRLLSGTPLSSPTPRARPAPHRGNRLWPFDRSHAVWLFDNAGLSGSTCHLLSNSQTPHTPARLSALTRTRANKSDVPVVSNVPAVSNVSRNALDGPAWRSFLDGIVTNDSLKGSSIAGQPLSEPERRQLHRWRREQALPSIWSADRFLTAHGIHLDAFFAYAEAIGRSPWALGWVPAWHEEDWIHEDVNWCDPDDPFLVADADRGPGRDSQAA